MRLRGESLVAEVRSARQLIDVNKQETKRVQELIAAARSRLAPKK